MSLIFLVSFREDFLPLIKQATFLGWVINNIWLEPKKQTDKKVTISGKLSCTIVHYIDLCDNVNLTHSSNVCFFMDLAHL